MNKEYRILNVVHGNNLPVLGTCGFHAESCTTMIVGALHMGFFSWFGDEATADSELFNAVRSNDADRFEDETTADLSACEAPDNVERKAPDNVGLRPPENEEKKQTKHNKDKQNNTD